MNVQMIQVPYDSGHRGARMGRGPLHLVDRGAAAELARDGHDVQVESVEAGDDFRTEVATAFELHRALAARVRRAVGGGRFPVVLAGNCNSCLGTVAALGPERTGVVWFDAHGDFNTPETTGSGFFDGMALAVATGHCWRRMTSELWGDARVAEQHVVHVGGRDFDPEEAERLRHSAIAVVRAEQVRGRGVGAALGSAVESLARRVDSVYVHVDLDVLDPSVAPANRFTAPNGLTLEQAAEAIAMLGGHVDVRAAAVTAYDPDYDPDGRTLRAALELIRTTIAAADRSRSR
jgi:arginase